MKSKIALIGIDAADLDFIQSSLSSLPHLHHALDTGTLYRLNTTADLMAGSVWPTFYTGSYPEDHGVYHHLQWDQNAMSMRRVSEEWLYCEPFWYELERKGLRVSVFDVPMTFPSRLQRGIELINWGSHDQLGPFTCNNRELQKEMQKRFGSHPMGAEIPVDKTRVQLEQIRANLVKGAKVKGEISRWLLETQDWDFYLTVLGECHRGGHILWPDEDPEDSLVPHHALRDVYQSVDRSLGEILNGLSLDETTVVIFSLHGMESNSSQEHFVPMIMDHVNKQWASSNETGGPPSQAPKQCSPMRWLRENVPLRLQHAIAQAVPVGIRDWVVTTAVTGGHDWPNTPGFPLLADFTGYLRFNIKGREKLGMLEAGSDELSKYTQWLHMCLESIRITESAEPLIEEVYLINQKDTGARSHHLPDVILRWKKVPEVSAVHSDILGSLTTERATGRGGNHRPEGFCIVLGDGLGTEFQKPPHIADLAPMIVEKLLPIAPQR